MWDTAGQGEREAARLRRAIEDLLVALGVRRGGNDFEDCVQEGLLAVLLLDPCQWRNEAFERQAAKWAAIAFLRAESRHRRRLVLPCSSYSVDDIVLEDLMQTDEYAAIAQVLSRRELLPYILAVHSPLTQRQIGAVAGLTPRSVRRNLRSARRKVAAMEAARAAQSEHAPQPASAPGTPEREISEEEVLGHVLRACSGA